jgi:hypothetical protein
MDLEKLHTTVNFLALGIPRRVETVLAASGFGEGFG